MAPARPGVPRAPVAGREARTAGAFGMSSLSSFITSTWGRGWKRRGAGSRTGPEPSPALSAPRDSACPVPVSSGPLCPQEEVAEIKAEGNLEAVLSTLDAIVEEGKAREEPAW